MMTHDMPIPSVSPPARAPIVPAMSSGDCGDDIQFSDDGYRAEMRRGDRVLAAVGRTTGGFTVLAIGQGPARLLAVSGASSLSEILRSRMPQVARMLDDPDDAAAVLWEVIDAGERNRLIALAGPGRSAPAVRMVAYGLWRSGRLSLAVAQRCDEPVMERWLRPGCGTAA